MLPDYVLIPPMAKQNAASSLLRSGIIVYTTTMEDMDISFDPNKRNRTLAERGLDFIDAPLVFAGVTIEVDDTRRDYGEQRIICYGWLSGRLVVIGYTPRGAVRHIFSMRKANAREKARLTPLFEI